MRPMLSADRQCRECLLWRRLLRHVRHSPLRCCGSAKGRADMAPDRSVSGNAHVFARDFLHHLSDNRRAQPPLLRCQDRGRVGPGERARCPRFPQRPPATTTADKLKPSRSAAGIRDDPAQIFRKALVNRARDDFGHFIRVEGAQLRFELRIATRAQFKNGERFLS